MSPTHTNHSIRPADAIETPSETTQTTEQEENRMSIHGAGALKKKNGRDNEVIESLLEGKTPEGWVQVRSDMDTDDDDGEVSE